ncbi:MAG: hypothetical protein U0271_26975 [Polyangiaceae bacterium]
MKDATSRAHGPVEVEPPLLLLDARWGSDQGQPFTAPHPVQFRVPPKSVGDFMRALGPLRQSEGSWLKVCQRLVQSGSGPVLPPNHPLAWPMLRALAEWAPDDFARLKRDAFAGWNAPFEVPVRLLYIRWLIANRRVEEAQAELATLHTIALGLEREIAELLVK